MKGIDSFVKVIRVKEAVKFNLLYEVNGIFYFPTNPFFSELYYGAMGLMNERPEDILTHIDDWKINYLD